MKVGKRTQKIFKRTKDLWNSFETNSPITISTNLNLLVGYREIHTEVVIEIKSRLYVTNFRNPLPNIRI